MPRPAKRHVSALPLEKKPDWTRLLSDTDSSAEELDAAVEAYAPGTLGETLMELTAETAPLTTARLVESFARVWPVISGAKRWEPNRTELLKVLSLCVYTSPHLEDDDTGSYGADEEMNLRFAEFTEKLEDALIRSRDDLASTLMFALAETIRPLIRRPLSNAELTATLQHSLEVHRGHQAAGRLIGSAELQDCQLMHNVALACFDQTCVSTYDSLWRNRRADALGLPKDDFDRLVDFQRPGHPARAARRSLAWQMQAELGLDDHTGSLMLTAEVLRTLEGAETLIPRLVAAPLPFAEKLAWSSANRDALPWLTLNLGSDLLSLQDAEAILSQADREDWRDREALQKRGLRGLMCPPKQPGHPLCAPPQRSTEEFRQAALLRPSRQLAEELGAVAQVRLGQIMGEVPADGTPEAEVRAQLLDWSPALKRRTQRLRQHRTPAENE